MSTPQEFVEWLDERGMGIVEFQSDGGHWNADHEALVAEFAARTEPSSAEHPDPMVAESRARDPIRPGPARWFQKRPMLVQAIQWDGTVEHATEIIEWVIANGGTARYHEPQGRVDGDGEWSAYIAVDTLDAVGYVYPGDWMMRGTVGEFYPCKPDVFAECYDPADPELSDTGIRRLLDDLYDEPDGD